MCVQTKVLYVLKLFQIGYFQPGGGARETAKRTRRRLDGDLSAEKRFGGSSSFLYDLLGLPIHRPCRGDALRRHPRFNARARSRALARMIYNVSMRKFFPVFFLAFFPLLIVSAESNAGFISGFWYSRLPFFAGETVRIYTAVQNQSGENISGTIRFFNNGEEIGESNFSAPEGGLIQKWIDWQATEGNHKFQVKLFDVKNQKGENLTPSDSVSKIDEKFADLDTDGDRLGNRDDDDDDDDGRSDVLEKKEGTNPLVFDTLAKKEPEPLSSDNKEGEKDESVLEKGKSVAERLVIEPAKKASAVVLSESKPVIEKIGGLLLQKKLAVEKQIEEDRAKKAEPNLAAAGASGFYEKIREKLPPVFRILYGWLLRFLVLLFKVWWIPFIIFLLVVFKIFWGFWRRYRR